jgi:hypothetical protein
MGGKFLLRGLENAKPHALGIALPPKNSFCLGQNWKDPPLGGALQNIERNANASERL